MNPAERSSLFSKLLYRRLRKDYECPPVIAVRISGGGWYVETKDGSFSLETNVSDIWEVKCECVEGWQAQKETIQCTKQK